MTLDMHFSYTLCILFMNLNYIFCAVIIRLAEQQIVTSCFYKKERMECYGESTFRKCSGSNEKGRRNS